MAATSDSSSSPWRHGRNFLFFFSMEAWPQTCNPLAILRKLLKTSNPTLFQSSTFGYENFQFLHFWLRKLPIPPLLVAKTPLANFRFLHFWLRKLETSNPLANFRFLELEN